MGYVFVVVVVAIRGEGNGNGNNDDDTHHYMEEFSGDKPALNPTN